jgi:hypothetical protein
MMNRIRLLAVAGTALALLLWAAPASAQVPPEACTAVGTVGDTETTIQNTTGQTLPVDPAGTVGGTAGCPQPTTDTSGDTGDASTSTTYDGTVDQGSASLPSSLPRTGAPELIAGAGAVAGAIALVTRTLSRAGAR